MNSIELRYQIWNCLMGLPHRSTSITDADLVSPEPGEPVRLRVHTVDPMGNPRVYTVSIEEIDTKPDEPPVAHNCVFGDECSYHR